MRLFHGMLTLSKVKERIGCHHPAVPEVAGHCGESVLKQVTRYRRHRWDVRHFRDIGCSASLDYGLLRLHKSSTSGGRFISDVLQGDVFEKWLRHRQIQNGILRPAQVVV